MQDLCHQAIHAGLLAFERISIRQESVFFCVFFFLIFWLDWVFVAVQAFPLLRREGALSS